MSLQCNYMIYPELSIEKPIDPQIDSGVQGTHGGRVEVDTVTEEGIVVDTGTVVAVEETAVSVEAEKVKVGIKRPVKF